MTEQQGGIHESTIMTGEFNIPLLEVNRWSRQEIAKDVWARQQHQSGYNGHLQTALGASQVVLVVKNPPANAEDIRREFDPWVGKIPLEEGTATHFSILAWRNPMDRGAWRVAKIVHSIAKSQTRLTGLSTHRLLYQQLDTHSSQAHLETFMQTDHILNHKMHLNKSNRTEITMTCSQTMIELNCKSITKK